jgi:hypothetical protein
MVIWERYCLLHETRGVSACAQGHSRASGFSRARPSSAEIPATSVGFLESQCFPHQQNRDTAWQFSLDEESLTRGRYELYRIKDAA